MMNIRYIKYIAVLIVMVSLNTYSSVNVADKPRILLELEDGASKGNIENQYNLGAIYMVGIKSYGNRVYKDYKKAYYWTKQAANNGHLKAMHNLGVLYRDGIGVSKDIAKAKIWFKKASLKGIIRSSWSLIALTLNEGKPVTGISNYSKAISYAKRIALGYYNKKQYKLALGELIYLSKLGDIDSKFRVAYIYISENKSEIEIKKAIKIFKELGQQHNDIESLLLLGQIYEEGQLVNKNTLISNKYYKQAFDQLRSKGDLKAIELFNLAVLYENGYGVKRDIAKAILIYKQAATKGDQQAKQALSRLASTKK